jgi:hypothetical protein
MFLTYYHMDGCMLCYSEDIHIQTNIKLLGIKIHGISEVHNSVVD